MADEKDSHSHAMMRGLPFGLAVGMAIGLPLGIAQDNIGLGIGIGLPIGVALAVAFGNGLLAKDKKNSENPDDDASGNGD